MWKPAEWDGPKSPINVAMSQWLWCCWLALSLDDFQGSKLGEDLFAGSVLRGDGEVVTVRYYNKSSI